MKEYRVLYGSNVSAGTYVCADCGHKFRSLSKISLPTCPHYDHKSHIKKFWIINTTMGKVKKLGV